MKKFEDKETVIILMTKTEATSLYNALVSTNEELKIVVRAGQGKEAVTETDGLICEEARKNLNPLRYALGDLNPMADLAKKYAQPHVYGNDTEGYVEIEALDDKLEWPLFLDELAKYGLTCNYSTAYDTFTIG